jgi:SAM-dependent methyltransferase
MLGVGTGLLRFRRWVNRSWNRTALSWISLRSVRTSRPLFGFGRGTCIDRVYIESLLYHERACIRGTVLEIADRDYTIKFGGSNVERSIVLHVREVDSPDAICGDLVSGEGVPEAAFDCIILTQTLPVLRDPLAALRTAYRALREGGVLLCTVPGISPLSRFDADRWGDYWRFSPQGVGHLFETVFGTGNFECHVYGNRVSATALLNGWVAEELRAAEIEFRDEDFPVIIGCRGTKRAAAKNQ